ncbi:hypothetical protein TNCV_368821 [Trichonephila clavipes]|nr:hypothetical protein TNCV_368821 [Trichonephila clavipes]
MTSVNQTKNGTKEEVTRPKAVAVHNDVMGGVDRFDKKSYKRAFGDRPRNFEPLPSDEDDTRADTPSPNYRTPPMK